jgi:Transposase IS116/IS110/IS902 family/Trypsin-like peptidase domain
MTGWDVGAAGIDLERVAELLVELHGSVPGRRGSGYRVSASAVLTAAHVVRGAVQVRVRFNADRPGEWLTEGTVKWSDPTVDAAVVTITPRPQDEGQIAPVGFGRVAERDAVLACSAMGFPRFKLRDDPTQALDDGSPSQYRDSVHAVGTVAVLSNRREGTLEVSLPPTRAAGRSWAATPAGRRSGHDRTGRPGRSPPATRPGPHATKNQLLGQVDRAFPGLAGCLSSLLDTKVGRLLVAEFGDPARLVGLGARRFQAFAAHRGVIVRAAVAERLVEAARIAISTDQATVARAVLADDLALLEHLEDQIAAIDQQLEGLLPATPFAMLTSVPGWGTVRAARYGAAVGDLARWPSARQVYRAAGLTPMVYASAGHRHDGGISREGSVVLRRALLDLGVDLWHADPAARAYPASLRARGKPGGVVATALAHRANRIAYALVRDQATYDPTRWK